MANLSGLNSLFAARLSAAIAAAEKATGAKAQFSSGFRTPQEQAQIKANSLGRSITYGGKTYHPEKTERGFKAAWPGKSLHQQGLAVDLKPGPVRNWVRAHAKTYGLETISKDEPHIQMARGTLKTAYDSTPNAFADGAREESPAIAAVNEMAAGQSARTLRKGMTGDDVRALQSQLKDAGLYKGRIDGDYGPKTQAAVRAAESRYGLTVDRGIAGPKVQTALANQGAVNDIGSTLGFAPPSGNSLTAPMSSQDFAFNRPVDTGLQGSPSPMGYGSPSPMGYAGVGQPPDPQPNPLNQGPRFSIASRVPMGPMSDPSMGGQPDEFAAGVNPADTQAGTPAYYRAEKAANMATRFHPQQAQMVRDRYATDVPMFGGQPIPPGSELSGIVPLGGAPAAPPTQDIPTGGWSPNDVISYLEHRAGSIQPEIGNVSDNGPYPAKSDPYAANRAYAKANPSPTFFAGPGPGELSPPGLSQPEHGASLQSVAEGIQGIPRALGDAASSAWDGISDAFGFGSPPATAEPIAPAVPPGGGSVERSYPGVKDGPAPYGWPGSFGAQSFEPLSITPVDPNRAAARVQPMSPADLSARTDEMRAWAPGAEYRDSMNWLSGLNAGSIDRDRLYSLHDPSVNVEDRRPLSGSGSDDYLTGNAAADRFGAAQFGPATLSPSGGMPGAPLGAPLTPGGPGYTAIDPGSIQPTPLGFGALNTPTLTPPAPRPVSSDGQVLNHFSQGQPSNGQAYASLGGGGGPGGFNVASNSYAPWGSGFQTPSGSYSNSPFTPMGYSAPNFNPISGGPTYAYQSNGQGGGTYVDHNGNVRTY